jgi:hypothetical protein
VLPIGGGGIAAPKALARPNEEEKKTMMLYISRRFVLSRNELALHKLTTLLKRKIF